MKTEASPAYTNNLTGSGLEVYNTFKLLVAKKTGGPRFADVTRETPPMHDTTGNTAATGDSDPSDPSDSSEPAPNPALDPAAVVEDERSLDQVMADGFAQIFHNGITADPTVVPGAGRAAVRVIVPQQVLDQCDTCCNPDTAPTGSAILEESLSAISLAKLGEYLCEGGTITLGFDHHGNPLDVGREQRLYTRAQRTALGVRDGGCRFPGCDKPPSWCEAHHIHYWGRDHGPTTIDNGILLCRYHHMLIHNNGWEIIRDTAQTGEHHSYWLKPPTSHDPNRQLIEMPTKNPLITALQHTHNTNTNTERNAHKSEQTLAS